MDDADTYINTVDMPFRFYPCLAAGLAYYIAMKRAPERLQILGKEYMMKINRAMDEDRDRASFRVAPDPWEGTIGMSRYATGKWAYGISDRSGF